MKKSRYELEREYSRIRNSWETLVNANVKLVDENKWLRLENKRIMDNIYLIDSMFNDPENNFDEECYCKVIKKIIEECKYGSASI